MSHDRKLIDTIKTGFARKATAVLQAIAARANGERWSFEAAVAAKEVLADRLTGRAVEPDHPEEEEADRPEYRYDPDLMAVGLLAGLFAGYMVVPLPRRESHRDVAPDLPTPFGPNMAWLAVAGTDTAAVADALRLRQLTPTAWGHGVEAAHRGSVFVTPPVGDWTLVVGTPLFHPPDHTAAGVAAVFETLGRHFEEVQYFSNLSDVGLFVWGQYHKGKLLRGYGWLGAEGRGLWDAGAATRDERDLGFLLDAGQPPRVDPGDGGEPAPFTEEDLFRLASYWSVDPMTLDVEFAEPVSGLLGRLPTPTDFERRRLA